MRSESRRSGTRLLSDVYRKVSASIAALHATKKFSKSLDKCKLYDIIQSQSRNNTKLIIIADVFDGYICPVIAR